MYSQFNNTSPEKNNLVNAVYSKYYDIDKIQTLKFPNKHKSLALFHTNACSFKKNFDELDHLLKCTNKEFDMTAVTETRITKQTSLTTRVSHRCWEHGGELFKIWWEGELKSIHEGSMRGWKCSRKCFWNMMEFIWHLIVKLLAISLEACKFTKNELLHTSFWRILARF